MLASKYFMYLPTDGGVGSAVMQQQFRDVFSTSESEALAASASSWQKTETLPSNNLQSSGSLPSHDSKTSSVGSRPCH